MQNVVLAAAALHVGSLCLGGFLDDALAAALRLPADTVPLYGVALGPPTGGGRDDAPALRLMWLVVSTAITLGNRLRAHPWRGSMTQPRVSRT